MSRVSVLKRPLQYKTQIEILRGFYIASAMNCLDDNVEKSCEVFRVSSER